MMLWRWAGLMVVLVGLIFGNNLGGMPKLATAQYTPQITEIAWSPDGASIAVGYDDGRLEIRGVGSQGIQVSLMGHTLGITTIAWNPAGTELASGSRDELFVWNASTGQSIQDLNQTFDFYPRTVDTISWNQDGSLIMSYYPGLSNDLQIWDATTLQFSSERQDDQVTDIKWSIDQNHVVASVLSGRILLKDPNTFATLLTTNEPYAMSSAWSPGAQRIVSGSFGTDIRIWAVPSGVGSEGHNLLTLQNTITLRDSSIGASPGVTNMRAITFSLSGNRVYTVLGSGEFAVWDANEGGMISSTQLPDAPITAAAFNQLGTQLAYGDANGILHLVDVATLVAPEILGDSLALFRASDGQATLINLPPNANPNTPTADNIITYDTGAPDAAHHGQWVMGDWDADGVATPGVYGPNGVFYHTDVLGLSSSWATTDLGLSGGSVVVGRFGEGGHDCIGVVAGMTLTSTCDLSGNTAPLVQMLDIEFAADADLQYGAGDLDGDGRDSIVIRQGDQIFYSDDPPNSATAEFHPPIEFLAPEAGPSQLVVGDWDADGVDSFGLYFVETGRFYGRNQTDGPLIEQQSDTSAVGITNINSTSWRFR